MRGSREEGGEGEEKERGRIELYIGLRGSDKHGSFILMLKALIRGLNLFVVLYLKGFQKQHSINTLRQLCNLV